jgi:two-component system sensor histidine kinase/response regulator
VVLMDVQMPVMNGLQATACIRKDEQGTGRHLPIVAMTAHAMRGDRERCLAAGMDAYLVKPIQAEEMFATVESFAPGSAPTDRDTRSLRHSDAAVHAAMFEHLGGDAELARELATIFLADRAEMMGRIERAIAAGDAESLRVSAHTLKGAVGNLGASAAAAAALRLEKIGASRALDQAEVGWGELSREIAALAETLESIAQPQTKRARPRPRRATPRKKTTRKRRSR